MRRKATAKQIAETGSQGNANINIKVRENSVNVKPLKLIKQILRPTKTPTGKGLGKAGAKRLGRLLKRAIQVEEEPAAKGKLSLPKTPVRLFKHQIQTETDNVPKTNTAQTKLASHHISQLILSVVAQCKHRGGISMSELKQTLAAGGYDITKNNRQVNVVTKRLVHNETLVRTTRSAMFRLNNKKLTDTTHVKLSTVKSPKPNGDLKQSKTASKSPKTAEKSQKQAIKTTKPRGKLHKPKGKTRRKAARTHKPRGKTRKPATRSQKLTDKTHKPATRSQKLTDKTHKPAGKSQKLRSKNHKPAGKSKKLTSKTHKSHKRRRKTTKARRNPSKPARKKRRSAINRSTQVRKTSRRAQRIWRRRPKRNRHPYKSSGKRQLPGRRLSKTRSRLKTHRNPRRRTYYY